MGVVNSPSIHSRRTDSATPGICKELIGQSVSRLRDCNVTEESLGDRLASDLHQVYVAVQSIADLYNAMEDDIQETGEIQTKMESLIRTRRKQVNGNSKA